MIKIYWCKLCNVRGSRKFVREHLKEAHHVKGKRKGYDGKVLASVLTENMGRSRLRFEKYNDN